MPLTTRKGQGYKRTFIQALRLVLRIINLYILHLQNWSCVSSQILVST